VKKKHGCPRGTRAWLAIGACLLCHACDARHSNERGAPSASGTPSATVTSSAPSAALAPPPPRVALGVADAPDDPSGATRLRSDVEYLASKELGGRATGELGARKAADFIEARFRELGLVPLGERAGGAPNGRRSYRFHFSAIANAKVDPPALTVTADDDPAGSAARPSPIVIAPAALATADGSSSGSASGAPVFVGWGVDSPAWDDYAGADLEGKIAVVLRGAPAIPKLTRSARYELSTFRHKIRAARAHHAAGLVIVSQTDALPAEPYDPKGLGLPAVVIRRSAARGLFPGAGMDEPATWIAREPSPPKAIQHRRVSVVTHLVSLGKESDDVVGMVPACDDSRAHDEWVVLGAHYDHLGMGGDWRSMTPWIHAIHPGADDNASGTSLVMEVARRFEHLRTCPLRNVVFVTFAGEELGLLGSAAWVDDAPMPMAKVVAMLNADMVGRLRDDKLTVEGTKGVSGWKRLFDASGAGLGLRLDLTSSDDFADRSDHASFAEAGVPWAFLFTGLHADYHRPSDTADKINAEGLERIATLATRMMLALSEEGLAKDAAAVATP
jgi:Zn-dependent M28 family amino/carboxypeptidase